MANLRCLALLFYVPCLLPLAAPASTILAIGAHAGDMEITAGAVLAKHAARGDRVVLLHLTLGEKGHPTLPVAAYSRQKKAEAVAAAKILGATVLFGPWEDGAIPDDEAARRWVAQVIRRERPSTVVTHAVHSIHKDHSRTHAIVKDAVLLASLPGKEEGLDPHSIRGIYYTDNWEDRDGFDPYLAVEISSHIEQWRKAVTQYAFIRGEVTRFPYLEYYLALARTRGAEAGLKLAEVFDVEPGSKHRAIDWLP